MPQPVQLTRLGRGLARLFGLQGQLPLTILEDISPIVEAQEVEDFARGELPWGVECNVGPVAAQFGFLQLANPAGNKNLFLVDFFGASVGGGNPRAGLVLGAIGGVAVSAQPRDGRMLAAGRSSAFTTQATNVAQVLTVNGGAFAVFIVGGINARAQVVVPPGVAFIIECDTANQSVKACIYWRERPLAPQELNP